jgi:hypothetical protein
MLDAPTHDAPSKTGKAAPAKRRKKPVPPVEHRFKPGQSGNPSGRPKKTPTDYLTQKAREHADEAIGTYLKCLQAEEAPWPAKVSAATEILNRGFGKAKQEMDVSHNLTISDAFEKLISRINGDTGPVLDAEADEIQQIEAAE